MKNRVVIEIDMGTVWRIIAALLFVWFVFALRDIVLLLLFAVVIASAVNPVARWLGRWRIPRVLAVLVIYIGAFFAFSLLLYIVGRPLVAELRQFSHDLPQFLEKRGFFPDVMHPSAQTLPGTLQRALGKIAEGLGVFTQGALSATLNLFGGLISAFAVLVISLYLSIREQGIETFLRAITPIEHEEYVVSLWSRTQRRIGRWLQGQLLLMVIIGTLVFLGLQFILHIRYALVLAVIAGMFEIVPVVGPIAASVPAILIALAASPLHALGVVLLYFVIQQLENHLIVPQLIQKLVGVDALVAIIALLIGGQLAGLAGIILAVPVAASITEFIGDMRKKRDSSLSREGERDAN